MLNKQAKCGKPRAAAPTSDRLAIPRWGEWCPGARGGQGGGLQRRPSFRPAILLDAPRPWVGLVSETNPKRGILGLGLVPQGRNLRVKKVPTTLNPKTLNPRTCRLAQRARWSGTPTHPRRSGRDSWRVARHAHDTPSRILADRAGRAWVPRNVSRFASRARCCSTPEAWHAKRGTYNLASVACSSIQHALSHYSPSFR